MINFELRNIFPENLMQATIQQGQTYYTFESTQSIIKSNSSQADLGKFFK